MNKRASGHDSWITKTIPPAFVLLWSTGWIVARFAAMDAEPLTFLLFRYAGAGALLAGYALLVGAAWPRTASAWAHGFASGALLHAFYLGGIWWAIGQGVPASISALLAALQPILTTALAPALAGERITLGRWIGVALGLGGLVLVLAPKLAAVDPGQLGAALIPLAVNVGGMISLTLGSFYQKRYLHEGDLRTVACIQYASAFLVTLPFALGVEHFRIAFTLNTILALTWSVVALSIVSIALLLLLIRRGEVARSAQLIFLVPPVAAIQAHVFFGEELGLVQILGMALTSIGVAAAMRR